MLNPGLHPLNCSHCGAPLAPGGRTEVICHACGRPHFFVAPAAAPDVLTRPAGAAQSSVRRGGVPSRRALVTVAAIVAALVALGVATLFWSKMSARARRNGSDLPADVPLLAGDRLTLHYSETT